MTLVVHRAQTQPSGYYFMGFTSFIVILLVNYQLMSNVSALPVLSESYSGRTVGFNQLLHYEDSCTQGTRQATKETCSDQLPVIAVAFVRFFMHHGCYLDPI
jgi:hypothetical protein